ncbi:hypothetical protein KP509_24G017300 [Ceratopteris richardii]|uniref:Large ribosomal subunit protein bL25 beta domain-containing protein n=1 Tax=Ceratopteris richardii TaxID=49495 RepID=A0A8T2RSW2_CERRI|nr:hypothetical protein KP509_24G017300 [Ceratopteris richardii]KAH7299541.1 hypothetical protein KP509_24G017300 [Ceratopteris richardii]KAH7299542.1 hypothetical protein KP509_24G017300 [Ceratopteris richardii]
MLLRCQRCRGMQSWLSAVSKLSSSHYGSYHSAAADFRPKLHAIARRKRGVKGAVYHRERGLVSAVICEGVLSERSDRSSLKDSSLVYLRDEEISSHYKSMGHFLFMSTVFVMHISNNLNMATDFIQESVLPRTVNFDSLGRINNVRFIRAPSDIKLKLSCPIAYVGADDCIGMKKGGLLKEYSKFLYLSCSAEMVPPTVEVNVSNLDIGGRFLVGDIKSEVDVHPDLDPTGLICEIINQA